MPIVWSRIFDRFGVKTVTKTDKEKAAYLPSDPQRAAIEAAGIAPSAKRPADSFYVTILNDRKTRVVASFYESQRSAAADRKPEARMGRAFISSWLHAGDRVLIGNIGSELFATKLSQEALREESFHSELARKATPATVVARAKLATGQPAKKLVHTTQFQRNPYVVMAALHRSGGKCEMPNCQNHLFDRDDGKPYLEVHHITPLADGGDDTFANVAALCPHCHRELHFGKHRDARQKALREHLGGLP